ncbi:Pyrimidine-nucleoside phosphorylase [Novipirellula galeiformis]|uniref:thymidine phosphorylase n=1 Tax=Novipirellula galeiformis TaxID=2528004 RepID=A0A5C6CH33_9BACT|nr:thymidine phosphorylase [Novipirellula galeiformis]TWU24213.1 Pyrimidine-nucleoside phosphorylase [Novipirellula galeiformis]
MIPATLLAKKRNGHALTPAEIEFLVHGFGSGEVADYQMSAFMMAVCIQGMEPSEISALTEAMLQSGDKLPRCTDRPRVDKHSTGGLGDKVSLILAPLLATCDVDVPMISGRGLGLTGGTLDKLESIEGLQTQLTAEQSSKVLRKTGVFIIGADAKIAPADRRLYAIRDVTGTVESVALITASILSKKLAARLDALVMDVKVGSGGFMKTLEQARELAQSLIRVGAQSELPITAILSDMDQPLGAAIGNAIEVNEAVDVLQGIGPPEVRELTIQLGANLLVACHDGMSRDEAITKLTHNLDAGIAMERFEQMVVAQGGRPDFPRPIGSEWMIECPVDGWIEKIDCETLGQTIVELGGGRRRKEDRIDPSVGLQVHCRVGQRVKRGTPILSLHCDKRHHDDYVARLQNAVTLSDQPVKSVPLLIEHLC